MTLILAWVILTTVDDVDRDRGVFVLSPPDDLVQLLAVVLERHGWL